MKCRILKAFRDKNTRVIYQVGEEIEFTEKRIKEILEVGKFVEKIKVEKPKKAKK